MRQRNPIIITRNPLINFYNSQIAEILLKFGNPSNSKVIFTLTKRFSTLPLKLRVINGKSQMAS